MMRKKKPNQKFIRKEEKAKIFELLSKLFLTIVESAKEIALSIWRLLYIWF